MGIAGETAEPCRSQSTRWLEQTPKIRNKKLNMLALATPAPRRRNPDLNSGADPTATAPANCSAVSSASEADALNSAVWIADGEAHADLREWGAAMTLDEAKLARQAL